MANSADTLKAGKIVEVTFTDSGLDWNHSTNGGFDKMYVKSIIWHPSGADDILVINEGGNDGPSIIHWQAYADLVTNGSFTTNTTGWDPLGSAVLASVSGGQPGNCLRITEDGETNPYARQSADLTVGKNYAFSFRVKQGTEATFRGYIYKGANIYGVSVNTEAGAGWTRYPTTFVCLEGGSYYVVLMQRAPALASTNIYFDTVAVEELPLNRQIDFGEKGVPLKPYIDISDCTFSDITATKIIFILE